jgi:hypothetical protein
MGDWDDSIKLYIRDNAQDLVTWLWNGAQVKRHLETGYKVRTLEADSVLEIEMEQDGQRMLFHIEIQSTRDPDMPERLLEYNVAAHRQHKLPVNSCVIYLRDVGEVPQPPLLWKRLDGQDILWFDYRSVELANIPVEQLKETGLPGLKPLFILAKGGATRTEMEEIVADLGNRHEYGLLSISRLFADLIFNKAEDQAWIERIFAMFNDPLAETPTYQRLVKQGRDEGLQQGMQRAVLDVIELKFPSLAPLAQQKVPRTTKPDALELLLKAVVATPEEAVARLLLESLAA